jgi:GH24 family phage-related lysozyme (muramidase)
MFEKISYIKKIGPNKFRVFSESGKNMGTYSSRGAAKKRLSQIEFFKRKSSISDDLFIKKVILLSSTAHLLDDFGLKKEASQISEYTKNLFLKSLIIFSGFATIVHLTNKIIESRPLEELVTSNGVNESLLDQRTFRAGTSLDEIVKELYGNISEQQKAEAIKIIILQNKHLRFKDNKAFLPKDDSPGIIQVKFPNMERVESKVEAVVFSNNEVEVEPSSFMKLPAKQISLSDDVKNTIHGFEGFRKIPYNSKSIPVWPNGLSKTKHGWTVGYGHLLTEDEIKDKAIKLLNGKLVHYWNGLSENDAKKVSDDDIKRHSIFNSGVSKDEEMSRGLYDALSDMSFNMGVGNLSKFIKSIRDEEGNLSSELFSKKIVGWTGSSEENRKGILIRVICRILIANEVKIPSDPKNPRSKEEYPSKDGITRYLIHLFGENFSVSDEEKLMKKLSIKPPKNSEDFLEIISSFG